MERLPNESTEDYVKRIFESADKAINNLRKTSSELKELGVIGFCSNCGMDKYSKNIHECIKLNQHGKD